MLIPKTTNSIFYRFENAIQSKQMLVSRRLEGKSYRDIGKELNMSQTAVMKNFWKIIEKNKLYPELIDELSSLSSLNNKLDFSNYTYGFLFALITKRELGFRLKKKTTAVLS